MKKLIADTLKPNGKWSIKRLGAFVGLLTYSATAIGMTVWNKSIKSDET